MKRARPIVAIDGPVGAGKSTVARELARRLGFSYLSTGAMYRAVALGARDAGIKPDSPNLIEQLEHLLDSTEIKLEGERVLLNKCDVSSELAKPEVSDLASQLSALPLVRARLRDLQHEAGRAGGIVMEGRDIGTVVFPDAEFKFFLDADVKVRAHRRWQELTAAGARIEERRVLDELIERDARDRTRSIAPLRAADDAVVIDATKLAVAQVVDAMKTRIDTQLKRVQPLKRD